MCKCQNQNFVVHPRLILSNGIACTLLAQVFYAVVALTFKLIIKQRMPYFQVLLFRSLSNTLFAIPVGLTTVHRSKLLIPKRLWCLTAAQSIFGNLGMMLFCISLAYMVEGDAVALARTSPIFATVLGWILGWDVLSFQIVSGVLICCVGGITLEHPPFLFGSDTSWSTSRMTGSVLAISSALSMAISFVAMGRTGSQVETITLVLWYHFTGIFMAAVPLVAHIPSPPAFDFKWDVWVLLGVFCISNFSGGFLQTKGTQLCNAVLGSSLQTSSVIFTYLLGFFVLGEEITVFAVVGASAITIGIVLIAHGKNRIQKQRRA